MGAFANKLDRLLADVLRSGPLERKYKLDDVRGYIRSVKRERLLKEISEITSEPELRQLAGAGVPGFAKDTFLEVVKRATPLRGHP